MEGAFDVLVALQRAFRAVVFLHRALCGFRDESEEAFEARRSSQSSGHLGREWRKVRRGERPSPSEKKIEYVIHLSLRKPYTGTCTVRIRVVHVRGSRPNGPWRIMPNSCAEADTRQRLFLSEPDAPRIGSLFY